LKYRRTDSLVFSRTPHLSDNSMLQQIPMIEIVRNNGEILYIEVPKNEYKTKCAFASCNNFFIKKFGQELFKKDVINAEETKTIELAFIQATLNEFNDRNLLVTENKDLLNNRLWLESRFSNRLNITTMEQASEIIDLLLKYNSKFAISDHYYTSKHHWYWLSFRTKIPNYHVDISRFQNKNKILADLFKSSILDAFSQRFCFLLMSIDEMGYQFYSLVNNDTKENITYHFNYFISLMTGIFDSLAIHTKNKYNLTFEGSHIPNRTSLQSDNGKDFLKALKLKNPALRHHIDANSDLIKLPYLLRDRIIHREGSKATTFAGGGWEANLLFIQEDFVECLKRCGDKQENYETWTKFGVYSGSFLNPYKFAKSATLLLSQFCDTYLHLMGYDNFIEKMRETNPQGEFIKTLNVFEEDNLGF